VINGLSIRRLLEIGADAGPALGIDTGTPIASLGVISRGQVRAVLARPVQSHCAGLPAAVNEALEAAELMLDDLAMIAVAIGPGSFTGLRVGLSYAKGLAMARGLPIVGVSTLDAMALCALGSQPRDGATICPIIDARRGEVYAALYRLMGDAIERTSDDVAMPLAELARKVAGEVIFVGESKIDEACSLAVANRCRAVALGGAELHLRASFAAVIGAAKMTRNGADDAASLEPLYVRAPDASAKPLVTRPGDKVHGTPRGRIDPAASGA
jgi:tRNA threonylcarbamoyladenosine biosynthesis protein TsaB